MISEITSHKSLIINHAKVSLLFSDPRLSCSRQEFNLYSAVEPPIPTQMSANIDDGDITRRTHLVKDRLRQKVPADDADERGFGTSSASICVICGQLLFLGST